MIIVILQRYLISEWIKGALSAEGSEKAFSFTPCWVIDKWRFYLGTFQSIYSKQTYGFLPSLGPLLDSCCSGEADTIQCCSQLISVVPSQREYCVQVMLKRGRVGREKESWVCKDIS